MGLSVVYFLKQPHLNSLESFLWAARKVFSISDTCSIHSTILIRNSHVLYLAETLFPICRFKGTELDSMEWYYGCIIVSNTGSSLNRTRTLIPHLFFNLFDVDVFGVPWIISLQQDPILNFRI